MLKKPSGLVLGLSAASLFLFACNLSNAGSPTTPASDTGPLATAVGVPVGGAVTATIGAAGGALTSSDSKLTVNIPAGALAANTVIGIQQITNNAPGAAGVGYRLTPDGQTFSTPVSLVLTYDDQSLGSAGADARDIAFQNADGTWQLADTLVLDTTAKTVTATTSHFCDWGDVDFVRMLPAQATLGVNKSFTFHVLMCFNIEGPRNVKGVRPVIGHKPIDINPVSASSYITDWQVNSIPGGNSTVGTISYGVYVAPATKPNPDTVEVGAMFHLGTSTVYDMRSSVKITDIPEYSGEMRFTAKNKAVNGDTWTATGWADVTLTQDPNTPNYFNLSTPSKIVFTSYETVQGSKTTTMLSQLSTVPAVGSGMMLSILGSTGFYTFSGVLLANGLMRTVDRTYDPPHVTQQSGGAGITPMTETSPTSLGLQPLGDGRLLVGSSTYADGETTIDLSWGLASSSQ
jgi:hypothetical protein